MLFSYSYCTHWFIPGTTTALYSTSIFFTLSSHPSLLSLYLSFCLSPSFHPSPSGCIQWRSKVTDVAALTCRVQSWPLLGTQLHVNTLLYHPAMWVCVCLSRSVCERQTETVCQEVHEGLLKQTIWGNRKCVIKPACVLKSVPKNLSMQWQQSWRFIACHTVTWWV